MSRTNFETLSKEEIRNYNGTSLYVLNTSDLGGREKRAELLLTVTLGTNKAKTIAIKSTWIPIDLMTHIPLNVIKDNEDFWHHVNRRAITVIDARAAEEFMTSEEAIEEFDRVYDISESDKREPDKNSTHVLDTDERVLQQNRASLAKGNLRREEGSAKVIAIMKREKITESNRLGALKNIEHELTPNDFKYIIKESRSDNQERIKEWATGLAYRN